MFDFKRKLWGYRSNDVEQYFKKLENDYQMVLNKQIVELKNINERNDQIKSEINVISEEIENLNQKKLQVIYSFAAELNEIESRLKNTQEEAREKKLAALQKLQEKVEELENWSEILKQCYTDLFSMQEKFNLLIKNSM